MSEQGTYDPNTFVATDETTWPGYGGPRYEVGWYWTFSVGGTWDGTPVDAGDRAYPTGRARRYDDGEYDQWEYEMPSDGPYPISQDIITWSLWDLSANPWLVDPEPEAGQRLYLNNGGPVEDDWRVVVELYDKNNPIAANWIDATAWVTAVVLRWGSVSNDLRTFADEITVEFLDPDAQLVPLIPDAGVPQYPFVSQYLRIGLREPASMGGAWHLQSTGIVDRIEDSHDENARLIVATCYGTIMDLAQQFTHTGRSLESAYDRLTWLTLPAGGPLSDLWTWGTETIDLNLQAHNVDRRLQTQRSPNTTRINYEFVNSQTAASGQIARGSVNLNEVRASFDDSDGTDWSAFLATIEVGDRIVMSGAEWTIATLSYNSTDRWLYTTVTPFSQGTIPPGPEVVTFEKLPPVEDWTGEARRELDLTANTAGFTMLTNGRGSLWFRQYPLTAKAPR